MKLVMLLITLFSIQLFGNQLDEVTFVPPEQPTADLKTPNQKVLDKYHQPGGAIKIKKTPVKIEGLNSTPAEKAATEKKLKENKPEAEPQIK